jgi:hypothetical protein
LTACSSSRPVISFNHPHPWGLASLLPRRSPARASKRAGGARRGGGYPRGSFPVGPFRRAAVAARLPGPLLPAPKRRVQVRLSWSRPASIRHPAACASGRSVASPVRLPGRAAPAASRGRP